MAACSICRRRRRRWFLDSCYRDTYVGE